MALHVQIDTATGAETWLETPDDPQGEAEALVRLQAEEAERQARRDQRAADIVLLAASSDPHHAAMARLLAGG